MIISKLSELFAIPLQSVIEAQSLGLQKTLSIIKQIGLEGDNVKTIKIKVDRFVEERIIDSKTGNPSTKLQKQPLEIGNRILALLPPPGMKIEEVNV